MKIVIIGAGSASFGSTMIRDLVVTPEMTGRGVRVTLVDTDPEALTRSLRFSKFLAARAGSDIAFDTNHTNSNSNINPIYTWWFYI